MNTDALMTMFGWVGIFTVGGGVIILAHYAFDTIRDVVRVWRWEHKYKHRFDKPPTAACYCKDCVHHGKNGNDYSERCDLPGVDRFTPHNGFCYMARPMTAEEAKKHGE